MQSSTSVKAKKLKCPKPHLVHSIPVFRPGTPPKWPKNIFIDMFGDFGEKQMCFS